ncbi:unnamed protein product [Urochloa decumbens]|uniref:Uncharacterized protein n=1 Tax=Urochloa decumbens TaxID=240449 RepID=A0ABC9GKL7_9POAL
MAATRPARSDPHLPPEEAARVEAEVRGYFDSVAPRRPAKPPRSDPSEGAGAESDAGDHDLPELRKLRDLAAKPQKLVVDGAGDVDGGGEEYVETRYYDGLIGIDKQHHTTGTGFIKVERPNGSAFTMTTNGYSSASFVRCTSNPATNDWIPSAETVIPASNKPGRSDS